MGGMPDMPAAPKEKSVYTYDEFGNLVSSEEVSGDTKTVKTFSTDEEKKQQTARKATMEDIQQQMTDFLPTLNSVDPDLLKQIEAQASSMTQSASDQLNTAYNDTMKQLSDNAAARFGSTENSYYDKERDAINKTLAEQQGQLAQDIEAKKSDMKQQELANRQAYYNNLNVMYDSLNSGSNDYINNNNNKYNQTMQANQMSNNFDSSIYASQISAYNAQLAYKSSQNASLFGLFSDSALKENIKPISVLDKLNNIGVYDYNYVGDSLLQHGVIAQELEKEFPELVSEHPSGYKTVNYSGLVPILLQAVKELKQQIGG